MELSNYQKFQLIFQLLSSQETLHCNPITSDIVCSVKARRGLLQGCRTRWFELSVEDQWMSFCLDVFKVNNLRKKTFEIEIHCLCLSLLPPKKLQNWMLKDRACYTQESIRTVLNVSQPPLHDVITFLLNHWGQQRQLFPLSNFISYLPCLSAFVSVVI